MNSVLEGLASLFERLAGRELSRFVSTLATVRSGVPYVVMVWAGLIAMVSCVLVFTVRALHLQHRRQPSSIYTERSPVRRTIVAAYA